MAETAQQAFDTPAKIMPNHVLLNPDDAVAVQRWAIDDDSPLGRAFTAGRLDAGRRGYTGRDRYEAGLTYRAIWDTVHGSGCGGFNPNRVSGGAAEARSSESLCIARDLLKRVNARMSRDNAFIIAQFIGEGSSGSDTIKARIAGFDKSVWNAMCMALDDLIDAVVALGLAKGKTEALS